MYIHIHITNYTFMLFNHIIIQPNKYSIYCFDKERKETNKTKKN